jgi:hypothetical protein
VIFGVTLREEIKVSENRSLRKIFDPQLCKAREGWRIFHTDESHNLHSSLNIEMIKSNDKIKGACSMHGREEIACKVSVEKLEGKSQRGMPRHRCVDNIKIYLKYL